MCLPLEFITYMVLLVLTILVSYTVIMAVS